MVGTKGHGVRSYCCDSIESRQLCQSSRLRSGKVIDWELRVCRTALWCRRLRDWGYLQGMEWGHCPLTPEEDMGTVPSFAKPVVSSQNTNFAGISIRDDTPAYSHHAYATLLADAWKIRPQKDPRYIFFIPTHKSNYLLSAMERTGPKPLAPCRINGAQKPGLAIPSRSLRRRIVSRCA